MGCRHNNLLLRSELNTVIPAMAGSHFTIWKTIKLGAHRTTDDFRTALENAGCYVASGAEDILAVAAINAAGRERTIDVVVTSREDLGFRRLATYEESRNSNAG